MPKIIKLKKGFEIKLKGKAKKTLSQDIIPDTYALKPTDFVGINRGKVMVEVGDNVKSGTPLFFDKIMDTVLYPSPVSGEVVEVRRGAKRKLLEIVILADKEMEYEDFGTVSPSDLKNLNGDEVKVKMLNGGVWPNIIQRPYGIVADPDSAPKAIFISGFDSHPLAPDYSILYKGEESHFQTGVDVLKKLTVGIVHLNLDAQGEVSNTFSQVQSVQLNKFSGPHPAGNVGVQIHHIDPMNKGEIAWTVSPYGVIQIGKLFSAGRYDATKIIALTGSEVTDPKYYKTYGGAGIKKFIEGTLSGNHVRVISGNVLTGEKVESNGHLGFYANQITVIPEGDHHEMFGWLLPGKNKLSFHRALGLFSFLNRKKEYVLHTNMYGGPRAFVATGSFEQVTPMDILPTYLLKAILAEDYDDMEALGIYEVIEEDLALCEFIDVSKHDVQEIVRDGIELMINS